MTWHDGLREEATDGTDLAHVREMWRTDGASEHMGIQVHEIDRVDGLGRSIASMTINETMVNGHGTTHGGLVFAFCDSVFALTCNTSGQPTVAAHCDIDFIAPTRLGEVVVGLGQERAAWGRNGITDVVVRRVPEGAHLPHEVTFDEDGRVTPTEILEWPVVAIFTGRSRALTRSPKQA